MQKFAFDYITPIIDNHDTDNNSPFVIGLSGAQGSGKSYASKQLQDKYGDSLVILSIDDFYLTKKQRMALAKSVHPSMETRGPPGTHDIILLENSLDALSAASTKFPVTLPHFDKILDDRLDKSEKIITKKPAIIIVEGWLVGAMPSADFKNSVPINFAETKDVNRTARAYQYKKLQTEYARLWDKMNVFIHMQAPSFEIVYEWRLEQQAESKGVNLKNLSKTDHQWVENFIQHYERITCDMMAGYRRSGIVLQLNRNREVTSVISP